MQAVHECGHILGALLTGAEVKQVVLDPLSISRTDIGLNPNPLFVVWAGPVLGVFIPAGIWSIARVSRMPECFVFRFFAGFCGIANGAYIAVGSLGGIGDSGEMLRHGSEVWMLWSFGAVTVSAGLWLWHGEGRHFGLGTANGVVEIPTAYATMVLSLLLFALEFWIGG